MIMIEDDNIIVVQPDGQRAVHGIGTPEAFEILSRAWLRSGWDNKYVYSFTWLGRPMIQLPEDMIRLQELIYAVKPDFIIETGVAHGGSLVFYAGLCKLIGKGRVIGVDVEIRPHNREALERHELADVITLVQGSSVNPNTFANIQSLIPRNATVMALLDSCHQRDHVMQELELYGSLVSVGSYMVAMDGIMQDVAGAPRTAPDWTWNNPQQAARAFALRHPAFVLEEPSFAFNEGAVTQRVTYWPCGILKRIG